MRRLLWAVLIVTVVTAACGGKGSPTAPSGGSGVPAAPGAPAPGPTATITGSVQGSAGSSLLSASAGAALTGVTVTVVGTSVTSGVDAGGRFTLMNVPPGDVRLQLTGGGANATVTLGAVQASQTVDVVVMVSGSSASLDSEVRSGAGEAQLEGRVESLPPSMPALTFKAAGRTVRTDASTRFTDGSVTRAFGDLQIGMRVHVKGSLSGETLTATRVELQSAQLVPVEVNGTIDGLTGSASGFQFNVGSTVVKGDSRTTILGHGDAAKTFADLKNGAKVEVKGTLGGGFLQATRIRLEEEESQGQEQEVGGTISNLSGGASAFQFNVGSTLVKGDGKTTILGHGNAAKTFADLKNGAKVEVKGTRGAGFLQAIRIRFEEEEQESGREVDVEGTLGALSGTCPTLSSTVGSTKFTTSSETKFEGASCSAFKAGDRVELKGTKKADGSVAATKLEKKK